MNLSLFKHASLQKEQMHVFESSFGHSLNQCKITKKILEVYYGEGKDDKLKLWASCLIKSLELFLLISLCTQQKSC